MMPIRSLIAVSAVILGFHANNTLADVTDDTNLLLDWAEAQYPNLFSPPDQPTQDQFGYIFRHYPVTQTYAGVHKANQTVHVLGAVFGPGIHDVGTLQGLLALIDSSPGGEGSGNCATVPLFVEGTRTVIRSLDPSGNATGTTERIWHRVTDSSAQYSQTLTSDLPDIDFTMQQEGDVGYHLADGYWVEDRDRVVTTSIIDLFTFTETQEVIHDSPGLKIQPRTLCEGDSWEDSVGCTTIFTGEDGTETYSDTCHSSGRVDAVNVSLTVPAGTFNTVRFVSDGGIDSDRVIRYIDTQTGTYVWEEISDTQGNLITTNVLQSISTDN